MTDNSMAGAEAADARTKLGLSQVQLAVEQNVTPAVVAAWEEGRIKVPQSVATKLRWETAQHERATALAASGLPECSWVAAFEKEPMPGKLEARTKRIQQLGDHLRTCDVCKAREAFIAERFPPMPPPPRPTGWIGLLIPIAKQLQRLPPSARPAAVGASLFVAYTLIRILFMMPEIWRSPRTELLIAALALLASASFGAVLGFFYGHYLRARDRESGRPTA